jgi:hypothetical protein
MNTFLIQSIYELSDQNTLLYARLEFKKRYEGTILSLINVVTQQEELVYIECINIDEEIIIYLDKELNTKTIKFTDTQYYFKRKRLYKGYYLNNKEDKIYYIIPLCKRQWKRGIYEKNYKILVIHSSPEILLYTIENNKKQRLLNIKEKNNLITSKDLYNYFTVEKKRFCFLNRHFVFIKNFNTPDKFWILLFHDVIIGTTTDFITLKIIRKQFIPELSLLPITLRFNITIDE